MNENEKVETAKVNRVAKFWEDYKKPIIESALKAAVGTIVTVSVGVALERVLNDARKSSSNDDSSPEQTDL